MSTKDNPGTLPRNLYAMGPPKVQPQDLTRLGDHPLHHFPQKEATELLYESNQIVCVKDDKGDSENSLVPACLQENVEARKVFVQDPLNPAWFLEDFEKYVEVKRIMCVSSPYKDHQDVLEQ